MILQTIAEIKVEPQWLDKVFSTGRHIELNGGVNTNHCRIWSLNNPQLNIQ